jgi:hypothetical protein
VPDEEVVFFVDDDLEYPADYVTTSLATLKSLTSHSALAYHAAWWQPGASPRYRDRKTLAFWDACPDNRIVTFVGSGTLCLSTANLRTVDRNIPEQFKFEDDVWISSALARAGIRCFRPKSPKYWIRATDTKGSLWTEAVKDGFRRRDACISTALALGSWKLNP